MEFKHREYTRVHQFWCISRGWHWKADSKLLPQWAESDSKTLWINVVDTGIRLIHTSSFSWTELQGQIHWQLTTMLVLNFEQVRCQKLLLVARQCPPKLSEHTRRRVLGISKRPQTIIWGDIYVKPRMEHRTEERSSTCIMSEIQPMRNPDTSAVIA